MSIRRLAAAVLAGGLLLAACGDDDSASTDPDAAADEADGADAAAGGSGPYGDRDSGATGGGDGGDETGATTVSVETHDELGEHLVGPDGLTLYLFTEDDGTNTACTGACADNWPPLVAASPTAGDGVDGGELSTAEGIEPDQVVYHGHLLYYFAGDQSPGDTNGTAVPSWFAVDPAGEPIDPG